MRPKYCKPEDLDGRQIMYFILFVLEPNINNLTGLVLPCNATAFTSSHFHSEDFCENPVLFFDGSLSSARSTFSQWSEYGDTFLIRDGKAWEQCLFILLFYMLRAILSTGSLGMFLKLICKQCMCIYPIILYILQTMLSGTGRVYF